MNANEGVQEPLLPTIWRQRWVVAMTTGACLVLCLLYVLVATPVYSIAARLYVHKAAPSIMSDRQDTENGDNYLYTQSEMLRSTPILALALGAPGTDEFKTFDGVTNRIAFLKKQLSVEVGRKDDLISVGMESAYPDEAVKIVNNVVNAYVAYQSTEKRTTAGEVLSILRSEKAKRDQELVLKDAALREFEQANGEVPLDGEKGNVVMQRLTSLSDALTQSTLQTLAAKSSFDEALKASGLTEAELSSVAMVSLSNTSEEQLRAELFVTRQRLEEVRPNYLQSHPVRLALENRVKQLSAAAVAVVRQRWITAQAQEHGLAKAFADQQVAALAMKARAAEYQRLRSEQDRLRTLSDNLDNRIKEVSVAQSAGALNINVFEPALASDHPTKPAKSKLLALALLAGLVLGAGLGVLREWIDPRVRSADEVKANLGLAVVGAIPRMPVSTSPEARGWAVHLQSMSPVAEAYRSVRTAVTFGAGAGEQQPRSILITSAARGDGKSTLASNLAIAMAKAGKRVLLIDCDFRAPVQHRIFGVSDDTGVASVLAAGEAMDGAIRRTAVERLDVLPCGPVPKDPSEILNSEQFVSVLEGLASVYDHVLIDSPPTSTFSDARIIGATCDATLLVVRIDTTNRRLVESARDGLQSVGAKIMGVVLNDIRGGASAMEVYGYAPRTAPTDVGERTAREPAQPMLAARLRPAKEEWHADDLADAEA
ncbi:MAG: polysaccharide biosynthesis tyrosine autokinase [Planctomycetota bacterium]|nr:polysaccharide biosynthesis tyrosine autokinase [Planctomycetota bacterium]